MERDVGNAPTTQAWKARMYLQTPISHEIKQDEHIFQIKKYELL